MFSVVICLDARGRTRILFSMPYCEIYGSVAGLFSSLHLIVTTWHVIYSEYNLRAASVKW